MNVDFALVNRALLNLGMAPLEESVRDDASKSKEWETAKFYYLHTMLETLAQAEWTGAKRRRELAPARMPLKSNADFAYAYVLPSDCAKPVELDGQEYFKVESHLLFTNAAPARLLYVSTGKFLNDQDKISAGNARRAPSPGCLSGGDAFRDRRTEGGDGVVSGGNAGGRVFCVTGEDFPEYRDIRPEPGFYHYWECLLSAKYAERLADRPGLANEWLAKAMAIGKAAHAASLERAAGRRTAAPTWQEELGLR